MSNNAEHASRVAAPMRVAPGPDAPDLPPLPLNGLTLSRHPSMTPYPKLALRPDPHLIAKARHFARAWMLRLRAWRVEQCLAREALAELSGLPTSAIKRAERLGEISLERFLALALALGLESELSGRFQQRRLQTPPLVLASRTRRRRRGRRATRERFTRRDRA